MLNLNVWDAGGDDECLGNAGGCESLPHAGAGAYGAQYHPKRNRDCVGGARHADDGGYALKAHACARAHDARECAAMFQEPSKQ